MPRPHCEPRLICSAGFGRFIYCATRSAHAQLAQDDFQRAEIGERGLQQIESDERGKPKPISTVIVCQHQADEDEDASKSADDHFHKGIFLSSVQTSRDKRPDHHAVMFFIFCLFQSLLELSRELKKSYINHEQWDGMVQATPPIHRNRALDDGFGNRVRFLPRATTPAIPQPAEAVRKSRPPTNRPRC
jgi:hypothetical protein